MKRPTKQIIAGVMIYFTVIGQVFGQAALLPNAEQQFFDNNGKPLASGTVDYYVPGTTNRKTTWQNSNQTVNNTNPVALDIGGKGIMYGQGSYRQVVKDNLGNVIWDQPTTAYGSSQPSGATGTDTAPVGSIMAFSGFTIPTNWQLAYGQALSRTTYASLMTAITISAPNIGCTNASTTLTGFVDTSIIRIGAPIEATCLPTSTTVATIVNATTITVSNAAAATSTVTATIFPWGNGDQVTTFNVPDYRGRAPVGADCMGYVASGNTCAGNLTATYYGANPGAAGQAGGTQSKNLTIANLNAFTPTGTISTITPAGSVSGTFSGATTQTVGLNFTTSSTPGGNFAFNIPNSYGAVGVSGTISGTLSGTPVTPTFTGASLGSGTAHSVVNPDATTNYIIKVKSNSTGAGGVVSFGGMFGDIVCDSTLTCAPIGTVNTVGCTAASTSQLGCVEPDGITTVINAGKLAAVAGIASSISVGGTAVTGGTSTHILFNNVGILGELIPSGTGSVCMTTNCVMTTPTLGAATATTINTNTFTSNGYTLTGGAGKTLTFNNTLTLAGVDLTTLTFQGTDTYVGRSTTDTLTNKTINGASNTLTVRLGSDISGTLPVANGGTGGGLASGTLLDNITGFSSTGFLTRTGAGTYAFQSATNGITLGNLVQSTAGAQFLGVTGAVAANYAPFTLASLTPLASPSATLDLIPCVDHVSGTIKSCTPGAIAAGAGAGVTSYNGLSGAVAGFAADKRIFVSTSGNDSNNGLSPESAKLTLQAAINASNPGGVVVVGAGTYTLSATLDWQPSVQMNCTPGTTITQGNAANLTYLVDFNLNTASNGIMDGCTIDGNRANNTLNNGSANINIGAANGVIIRNSTVTNSRGNGILIGTGGTYSIINNSLSNNYYSAIYAAAHADAGIFGEIASNRFTLIGAHAITQSGGDYNIIHDNYINGTLNNGGFAVTVSGTSVTATAAVFSATCDGVHVCPGNFIIAGGSGIFQELFITSVSSGTVATASAAGTSVTGAAALGGSGDLIDIAYNANGNRIYNNTLIFGAGAGIADADADDSSNSSSHGYNEYTGNRISNIGGNCIAVEQSISADSIFDIAIRDNYLLNCLNGGSGIYLVAEAAPAAIWLSALATANVFNIWLTGNSYFDTTGLSQYWLTGANLAAGAIHGGKNLTIGAVNGTTVGGVAASLGTAQVVP